ncbi:MAG: hypothetical protein Q8867_09630 [Bacteroidota bacterium]|nr:hypothetical protein [Bacteroidota bacterium]
MDAKKLEKYSSAFTLSDMEIFIFPDLLYSLVLANIMSPVIWKWRDEKWFEGMGKMQIMKRVHRVKQYIMDHYNFNLDLETWGLTDKSTEINRFREFIDPDVLSKSNALFGYEGDKYYFDIDIRKHFGLDKYDSDIIPYWKTETVEAMDAFRYKPGRIIGAGECVSLACLYAAALFIIAEIPIENIFLMGTPLHSQNFILVDDGIITNNRRIVTKSMWFNGTELSALARRALEHEQITMVAHATGYIHYIYPEATICKQEYQTFRNHLCKFLETKVSFEIFINFLRDYSRYQKLFQLVIPCQGTDKFIGLEKAFGYEHGSKNRIGDKTGKKLLCEMEEEDLSLIPVSGRILISPNDDLFAQRSYGEFLEDMNKRFPDLDSKTGLAADFRKFIHTVPRLPSSNKQFTPDFPVKINPQDSREKIIAYLSSIRNNSVVADLAFYTGRHMNICDWRPFLKAAYERNPVSVEYFSEKDPEAIYHELQKWPGESIYDSNRLALPDEVVNFKHGDGLEKAITFMNVMKSRYISFHTETQGESISVKVNDQKFCFRSLKELNLADELMS